MAARLGQRATSLVRQHPRRLYAAILLGCAGFGVTAFGVAPLTSIDTQAQHIVTESIAPADLQTQVSSLAQQELSLYRNDTTRPGDTVDSLLRRLGVDDAEAATFLRRNNLARELLSGRSGKMVQVRADASGQIDRKSTRLNSSHVLRSRMPSSA